MLLLTFDGNRVGPLLVSVMTKARSLKNEDVQSSFIVFCYVNFVPSNLGTNLYPRPLQLNLEENQLSSSGQSGAVLQ